MDYKKGFTQGLLSAQFARTACALDNELGHKARTIWLQTYFGEIQSFHEDNGIKSVLPRAFHMNFTNPLEAMFYPDRRLCITLDRVEAVGQSLRENVSALYKRLNTHLQRDTIALFLPKKDQTPQIVMPDKKYVCIKKSDEFHDHQSSNLLDFVDIFKHPLSGRLRSLPFDIGHCHLMDPALTEDKAGVNAGTRQRRPSSRNP